MSNYQTFVTRLLRAYHRGDAATDNDAHLPDPDQIRYLCNVGFGPISFAIYGPALRKLDPESYSVLRSSDLTTRVIYAQMRRATAELLTELNGASIAPVLLKGISTSAEFYSPPYLRLMGDVDLLVENHQVDVAVKVLTDLGFEFSDQDWHRYEQKRHHHLPGGRHPESGLTVEIHTSLIPLADEMAREPIYQAEEIRTQLVECSLDGARAFRFSPEYQLAYTVGHWATDGGWATNLTDINDAIHILRKHGPDFDWSTLRRWFAENPRLRSNTAALVSYLDKTDIVGITPSMRHALESAGRIPGPMALRVQLHLIHNYPFNAAERERDSYSMWRTQAFWQELTRPGPGHLRVPYAFLRAAVRSIVGMKFRKPKWAKSLYSYLAPLLRMQQS